MNFYICYMYLGDPENKGNWAHYHRTDESMALDIYNKWKGMPKEDITGFGVVRVTVDPVTGLSSPDSLRHHVNPIPKKVIYNQVAGVKAKAKPSPIQYQPVYAEEEADHVPGIGIENNVNWAAIHEAFANQA